MSIHRKSLSVHSEKASPVENNNTNQSYNNNNTPINENNQVIYTNNDNNNTNNTTTNNTNNKEIGEKIVASESNERMEMKKEAAAAAEKCSSKTAHYALFAAPEIVLKESGIVPEKRRDKASKLLDSIPIRYVVLALSLFCLSLVVANSLALNFTVICMQKERPPPPQEHLAANNWTDRTNDLKMPSTNTTSEQQFEEGVGEPVSESMFTLSEQGWLFAAIAIGQLLGTLPITQIYTRVGLRKMFVIYGMISAIATILIPPSIYLAGLPTLMAMRICQGIGMASIWVVIGSISSEWCPLSNSGIFLSILTINFQLGPITAMPLAGALCSSQTFGWPWVYYVLGVLSFFMFSTFYCFFRESPRQQKFVSARELAIIEKGKYNNEEEEEETAVDKNGRQPRASQKAIPYKAILSDPVFWALFTCSATCNMSFQVFWQFGPVYLNKTLGLEVAKTGIAAAIPFLLSAVTKTFAGQISDRLVSVSEKAKVIFFASISQYVMASCFLALALMPTLGFMNITFMQCMFTGATVFSGLNAVGVVKSIQLISRQFSHVIFSWNTLMLSVIMLLLPLGISYFTPTNSVHEWTNVFYFVAASVLVGTTFFIVFCEVEPREWTKLEASSKNSVASSNIYGTVTLTVEEGKKLGKEASEAVAAAEGKT